VVDGIIGTKSGAGKPPSPNFVPSFKVIDIEHRF